MGKEFDERGDVAYHENKLDGDNCLTCQVLGRLIGNRDTRVGEKKGMNQRTGRQPGRITLFLETAADYGLCIYLFLILAVLPFYFTEGYSHIGTDKAQFFRALTWNLGRILLPLAFLVFAVRMAGRMRDRFGKKRELSGSKTFGSGLSATDVFVMIYGIGVILSYLLSDYRDNAFWGAKGWFMGFFTQLTFVLIYFLVSRLWKPRKWMLYSVLPVSAAVFLLGYLDRFGMHLLKMENRTEAFISTIGNVNWYCGYAVCVFFLGVIFLWKGDMEKTWQKILLMGYTVLGFGTLMTQGSESGAVVAGVILLILFVLSVREAGRMLRFWQIMTLFSAACLFSFLLRIAVGDGFVNIEGKALELVVSGYFSIFVTIVSVLMLILVWKMKNAGTYRKKGFIIAAAVLVLACVGGILLVLILAAVNTMRPGSIGRLSEYSLFTFSARWGSNRAATWGTAVMCIREQDFLHKLFGVGPDAMSAYMYQDGSETLRMMLEECFGSAVLTNAHNEWLTVLADVGIFGFIGFAGAMISAMVRFLRKGKQNALLCAIGFCLLAYTVNNLFSFQQTMNGATIYALLGMGAAFAREEERH